MGCGISTSNLPHYLRGRRNAKNVDQLGWHDHDIVYIQQQPYINNDDHAISSSKLLIKQSPNAAPSIVTSIDDHLDSSRAQKSVSSPISDPPNHLDNGNQGNKEPNLQDNNEDIVETAKEINNQEDDKEDENEEGEGEDSSRIGDSSWIGSPSFRDYCRHRRDSIDYDGKNDAEKAETTAQGRLSPTSAKPDEVSNDSSSRGSTGRRLRKVFPVGRSASAMKNILNVTCYNPNNATSRVGHGSN